MAAVFKRGRIAVTMGDPAGIGPEVTLKALEALISSGRYECRDFVLVGCRDALHSLNERFSLFDGLDRMDIVNACRLNASFKEGLASRESGAASYACLEKAVEIVRSGLASALVTAPISKEALKLAGVIYPGHTEILQALCGAGKVEMAFCGKRFNLILLSRHISLRDALDRIDAGLVAAGVVNGARFMRSLFPGAAAVEVIVPGLNPHASENGMFGREEAEVIAPGVERARKIVALEAAPGGPKVEISGPEPADTVFHRAYAGRGKFLVVSLYHDQGLAPFKMVHFDSGVNVTLGLPFIRTSPDHGTAFGIAGGNLASHLSMARAMELAFRLRPVELF